MASISGPAGLSERLTVKSGKVIRNVEIFRFEGGKLAEVDVYFGRTVKEAP